MPSGIKIGDVFVALLLDTRDFQAEAAKEGAKAGERLKAVAGTLDGFVLADLDLQERREGDVLGLNQSGRPISLRFLSLAEHLDVIIDARELCEAIYAVRPDDRGMAVLAGHQRVGEIDVGFRDHQGIQALI